MTAARIRAQFPTSDGFGDQLKGCCRPPFVWASYNISRYIGRHSSRENNVPYCSHYSSSNTVSLRTGVFRPCTRGHVRLVNQQQQQSFHVPQCGNGQAPRGRCLSISTLWKVESLENTPLLLQPWYTVLSRLQPGKTRISQLNLCRMKLPYRQRQQERASRVRRDHKLALRTAFAALILVTTRVVSAAATI